MSDRPTPERIAEIRQFVADQRSEDDGIADELLAEIDALTRERDYWVGNVAGAHK